jgi:hypothetical protein
VPNSIITDNGTNFTSGEFQEFVKNLGIKIKYASVAHPKSARPFISKASAITTADGYADGPSSQATSSSDSSKQARRSWSRHGRAHTSSTKQSQEARIGCATPRQGKTSTTHGTHISCVGSILRANTPSPHLYVTKRQQQSTLNHCAFGAK